MGAYASYRPRAVENKLVGPVSYKHRMLHKKSLLWPSRIWYTRTRKVVTELVFPYELEGRLSSFYCSCKLKMPFSESVLLKNERQKLVTEKILGENDGI